MKTIHHRIVPATLLLVCLLPAPRAQDDTSTVQPQLGEPTISVDFKGGTLREYVDQIRTIGKVNVVMADHTPPVEVPKVILRNAEIEASLEAVANIVFDQVRVDIRTHGSRKSDRVYSVIVSEHPKVRDELRAVVVRTRVRVFSLGDLITPLPGDPADIAVKPEVILTAIETGLEINDEGADKAVIRYHKEAGLLFVRGTVGQTEIVAEILSTLQQDVVARRNAAKLQESLQRRAKQEEQAQIK